MNDAPELPKLVVETPEQAVQLDTELRLKCIRLLRAANLPPERMIQIFEDAVRYLRAFSG